MKTQTYLIFSFILLFASCKTETSIDDDNDNMNVEIDPKHEFSPPIASAVFLEELKEPDDNGNNLKLVAEFEKGAIEGQYLALLLNDKKVMLRDDGKGADDEAGDNQFSIHIKEDMKMVKEELTQRQKLRTSRESNLSFIGRKMETIPVEKLRGFDIRDFEKGNRVRIPLDILKGIRSLSDQKKTLLITDIGVVEDPTRTFNPCTLTGNPNGAWTFGELMRQMASPNPSSIASDLLASNFVRNWLNSWNNNQTVNGEFIAKRNAIQNIIIGWENRSGVLSGGVLDMKFAPFKLIAIVNRLDLRGNSGYGFSNAGEGRLVFNSMNSSSCSPLEFNVIFEYGINKRRCNDVKTFAQEWQALNSLTLGSAGYNAALQDITDQFTLCGTSPTKPNQNSINQIRTNEIVLGSPWELREFNLKSIGQLELVTVKQEPAVKYNAKISNPDVERLVAFINLNTTAIENDNYTVPLNAPLNSGSPTPTTPFLGGKSHTPFPPTGTPPSAHHWDGTNTIGPTFINSNQARHIFSLNTCSGCHGGETQTFFKHINPASFGSEATLSGFLTGKGADAILDGIAPFFDDDNDQTKGFFVSDAAARPIPGGDSARSFSDLLRRENDLASLIANNCLRRPFIELAHTLTFIPMRMTH